jgi:RND family efflux transporter MFP subunit
MNFARLKVVPMFVISFRRAAQLGLATLLVSVLVACGPKTPDAAPAAPWVKTVAISPADGAALSLSGTVRARVESPLAFQVGGRIALRRVDSGQTVQAGQVLFELDKRDLDAGLQAAQADAAAAEAAWAIAESEWRRNQQLNQQNFISTQALDRSKLALREAQTRRDAAAARLRQSGNTQGYGWLRAPAAGVLMEVTGQAGQVVAAGQTVAVLAQQGERELEVFLPENATPPRQGQALLPSGPVPIQLRETAGSVDPQGRTRRARYTLPGSVNQVTLGALLRAEFSAQTPNSTTTWTVPIGAIDERGQGARVWLFVNGTAQAQAVEVVSLDGDQARIRAVLPANSRVVALGTHLLQDGMAVRELAP